MAATFTVEDGTGLAAANSYLSEADADQYHENYGNPSSWSGATTAAKEAALREATRYLDAVYGARWKGVRADEDQALDWPRCGAYDVDGYAIDDDEVPAQLENATAILALKHVDGTTLLPDVTANPAIQRERKKVGPLETETAYFGGKQSTDVTRFELVEHELKDLIWPAGRLVRE